MRRSIIRMKLFFTGPHSAGLLPPPSWGSTERLDDGEADGRDNSQNRERITDPERDLPESS